LIPSKKGYPKREGIGAIPFFMGDIPSRYSPRWAIPCALGSFAGEGARSLHIPTRFDTLAQTSLSPQKLPSRIQNCQERFTARLKKSKPLEVALFRWLSTSATRNRSIKLSPLLSANLAESTF
jgi:hypothetical protein